MTEKQNKTHFRKIWMSVLGVIDEPKNVKDFIKLCSFLGTKKVIAAKQVTRICQLLNLENTRVRDIMIARPNMTLIRIDQSIEQIRNLIKDSGHSRFPVLDEDNRKVLGIVFAKDLVVKDEKTNLKDLVRKALFIPETKRLDNLLSEFQRKHQHMAIVIDEYGDHAGLITIEDIIEQITGDIEDEHDFTDDDIAIRQIKKNIFQVQATTTIDQFNEQFGTKISDKSIDTIGGIVLKAFGYIPKAGESIMIKHLDFKVHTATEKQLIWLIVDTSKHR